jgi:hypothetical protein
MQTAESLPAIANGKAQGTQGRPQLGSQRFPFVKRLAIASREDAGFRFALPLP